MKQRRMVRMCAFIVVVALLCGMASPVLSANLGRYSESTGLGQSVSGSFSAMYNSDAIFAEQVAQILAMERLQESSIDSSGEPSLAPSRTYVAQSEFLALQDEVSMETRNQRVVEAVSAGSRAQLTQLGLSEETQEMVENAYAASRVDRFIVKYQSAERRNEILRYIETSELSDTETLTFFS